MTCILNSILLAQEPRSPTNTTTPTPTDVLIGVLLGFCLGGYHLSYQVAAKMEKRASNLGILLNFRDVFIYLFDIFILGHPLVLTNLIGAVLITLSSLLIFFNNKK